MNATLARAHPLDADRLLLTTDSSASAVRTRLAFVERLELRLGLWLLVRSARRFVAASDPDEHRRRTANAIARAHREHVALLRAHALGSART